MGDRDILAIRASRPEGICIQHFDAIMLYIPFAVFCAFLITPLLLGVGVNENAIESPIPPMPAAYRLCRTGVDPY